MDLESQAAGAQRHGMILPFVRLAVTFRAIRYYVPTPGEARTPAPLHIPLAPAYEPPA